MTYDAKTLDVQIALTDLLIDAGASPEGHRTMRWSMEHRRGRAYGLTPLGWAEYSRGKPPYDAIAAYLRERERIES